MSPNGRSDDRSGPRPIGFWLKLVDRLLDERLDATLHADRLTRRHWQVANVLRQGGIITASRVDSELRPFLDDELPTTAPLLGQLCDRGWAAADRDGFRLTDEGRTGLDRLQQSIADDRRAVSAGITEEQYGVTLAVLERMAHNLGWE
jgi:hypothetical protein